jgi:hypothetical protein
MEQRAVQLHKEDVMKIANALRLSNVKTLFPKAALLGLVAGAAFLAAPQKANAQVAFGVRVGPARVFVAPRPIYVAPRRYYAPPVYVAPAPVYGYGYYHRDFYDRRWDHRRFER